MRILVCGGRFFHDYGKVRAWFASAKCKELMALKGPIECIIHGGATGADTLADQWARANGVMVLRFPAKWEDMSAVPCVVRLNRHSGRYYNAAAGGIRNQQMLDEGKPDVCVAFTGGKGTADMVGRALKASGVIVIHA